ncbi:hypothetical protein GPA26_00925 [Aromatoleum petrolei]|uniref:Uncharacterized protein n=2 Tax=Aromatoleum petrolei TaxID=76116 RepID=A0ABX1MGX4_9RHOO|nr:hypothetical protein [Aromatoleum petrolei]QTQ34770.1 Uncharacterized protein ToN1_05960 [Aromatoleum petrolei]
MKMFSKEGVEMVEVKSIQRKDDTLVMKGKVMGSMATTILIRPEDCWQALRLLGWRTLLRMPLILFRGYRQAARSS